MVFPCFMMAKPNGNRLGRVKDHLDGKFMSICKIEKAGIDMLAVYFEQLSKGPKRLPYNNAQHF